MKRFTKKKKEILITSFLVILFLIIGFWYWRFNTLTKIPIQFICTTQAISQLSFINSQYHDNWFIITHDEQYQNWIADGLSLPECDFSQNYLVISKYRIKAIYYNRHKIDECCGAPRGIAEFETKNDKTEKVYIYKMPIIDLSQGIG